MKAKCLYCYETLSSDEHHYHPKCSRLFFGTTDAPHLAYKLSDMEELAASALKLSVSVPGVQPKLSLDRVKGNKADGAKSRLTILDALEGRYILKPQNSIYPQMPENEHVSMKLAELFQIDVVPSALIYLASGEMCYITKRIDRNEKGGKIHMIDFLQLLELEDKYLGTMENLGKRIGELSANTLNDKFRFFELALFNFIIGNNDMHLKNFSMLHSPMGWVLAPAYDLINVKIILPKDKEDSALMLGGKKMNFTKVYFDQLAEVLKLNLKQRNSVYNRLQPWLMEGIALIEKAFLDDSLKANYIKLVKKRVDLFRII